MPQKQILTTYQNLKPYPPLSDELSRLEGFLAWTKVMDRAPPPLKTFLNGLGASVVSFTPNGRSIITVSSDRTVRIWKVTHDSLELSNEISLDFDVFKIVVKNSVAAFAGASDVSVWNFKKHEEIFRVNEINGIRSIDLNHLEEKLIVTNLYGNSGKIWLLKNSNKAVSVNSSEMILFSSFSPTDDVVATGGRDKKAILWDAETGKQIFSLNFDDAVTVVAFSDNGQMLAAGSSSGNIVVSNTRNGDKIREFYIKGGVTSLDFGANSSILAAGSFEGEARVWKIQNGHELNRFEHTQPVAQTLFGLSSDVLVTSGYDFTVRTWSLKLNAEVSRIVHQIAPVSIAVSPDTAWLAAASAIQGQVGQAGRASGKLTYSSLGKSSRHLRLQHSDIVDQLNIDLGGKKIATLSLGGDELSVWELATGDLIARRKKGEKIETIALSNSGTFIAIGQRNGSVILWDIETDTESIISAGVGPVHSLEFLDDDSTILFAFDNGRIGSWNTELKKLVFDVNENESIRSVVFDEGNNRLIVASNMGASIWSVDPPSRTTKLRYPKAAQLARISPDNKRLAAVISRTSEVIVWDIESGKSLAKVEHGDDIWDLSFSPNSEQFVTTGYDGVARLWSVISGSNLGEYRHDGWVIRAIFDVSGRYLATASTDQFARIWDIQNRAVIARLDHTAEVSDVAFGIEGRLFASGGWDRMAQAIIWRTEDLVRELCNVLHQNMNRRDWTTYFGREPYRRTCDNLPMAPE